MSHFIFSFDRCAESEDQEIARALTALAVSSHRSLPKFRPRSVQVGNACACALGAMPETEGRRQITLFKGRIKFSAARSGDIY